MAKSHWCLWGKPWPPPAPKQAPLDFAIASVLDSWSWSPSIRLRSCCRLRKGWLLNYTPLTMAQSWYGMYFICIYIYIYIYWNHMKLKLLVYTTCTLNTLFSHVFSTRSGAFPDKSSPIAGAPRGSIPKTKLPIGAQVEPRKTCRTDESFYSFSHHFDSFSWIKKNKLFQEFLEIRQLELPGTANYVQISNTFRPLAHGALSTQQRFSNNAIPKKNMYSHINSRIC